MKAAVLHSLKKILIEERESPRISPEQVLVRVKAVGVCGSDVHYYLHGRIGDQVVTGPFVLGHEPAGEIVEIGSQARATHLRVGMAVAIEPGIPCGICEPCVRGKYNLCAAVRFLGTPPVEGAFREYLTYPPEFLHPLPDNISFAEATLVETLAVGMHATELVDVQPGDDVAILGCGPVGLVTLKTALLRGAARIFISDLISARLKIAASHEQVITIDANTDDPVEVILSHTGGRGVDVVFDAAGALKTIRQTIEVAAVGGRVAWIGIPAEDSAAFDPHLCRRKELFISGVRRFRHNHPRSIQAIASGKITVKDLITHTFRLAEVETPFHLVEKYQDGIVKAVIEL